MGINLYYHYQSQIRNADLIEFRGNSLLGSAVRARTKQSVNHTATVLEYQMVGGKDTRRYIGESLADGFNLHYLSDSIKNYDGEVYWSKLKMPDNSYLRVKLAEEILKIEGKPYGYTDIINLLFKRVKLDLNDRSPVCSAALQIALIKAGLLDKNYNDGHIMYPGEFNKTKIYYTPVRIY